MPVERKIAARDPAKLRRLGFSEEEIAKKAPRKSSKRTVTGVLTEHEEQKKVIKWAWRASKIWPELSRLFAVPNGAKRSQAEAAWAKAEGLRPGVPDLLLPVRRAGAVGLALEMKSTSKTARVSTAQTAWPQYLESAGWVTAVPRGADAAIKIIEEYMSRPVEVTA